MSSQETSVGEQLSLFPAEKRCGTCGRLLPLEAFGRHKKAKDGLNWCCKPCAREQARVYYAAHKEELKARAIACRVLVTHKRCCECDALLPVSGFQRTTRTRDGYQSWCTSCRSAYDRAHKAEKAHYDAAYRTVHAERLRQSKRLWRARHAEHLRAYRQRHAAANSARVMRYYRADPEPFKMRARHRRSRLRRIPGTFTVADIALIREAQRGNCAYCGTDLAGRGVIEHMTPVSKGGSNWPWNLCLACEPCNSRKHTLCAGAFLALLLKGTRAQQANQAAV